MSLDRERILFLHPSDEAYGADRILLTLADGLQSRGWNVDVALPDDVPVGWLTSQLMDRGIAVHRGPLAPARRRYLRPRMLPEYLRRIIRARRHVIGLVRQLDPAIVHVNTSALIVLGLVPRLGRARHVWQIHEIVLRPRGLAFLFRAIPLMRADRVVAVSDAVRRWVGRIPFSKARAVRIHNGIDHVAPEHRGSDSVRVAFVGRLNRWKGYEVFIEAVGRIAEGYPEATFLIVGDPPPGEEHRAHDAIVQVEAAGLTGRLELLGFRSDVPDLLAGIDVLVVPSTLPDPFPTVILEGMRAGCAVVASEHGGAPEMLEHDVDGLLVEPGNARALAHQLERLLTEPGLRSSLGARARRRVQEQFGIHRFLDEWEQLYRELMAS